LVIIDHNLITGNNSTAVYNYAESAGGDFEFVKAVFTDNIIENNTVISPELTSEWTVGSSVILWGPTAGSVVRNNIFRGNTSNVWSGGLSVHASWITYDSLDQVLVENNYFLDNDAKYGGALGVYSNPVLLQNNVFSSNHASGYGGAIYCENRSNMDLGHMITLINNSFFGNKAENYGGAIYTSINNAVKPLIMNCVVWGDTTMIGDEIYCESTNDEVEIVNSDINPDLIYALYTNGGGMINTDPLFFDEVNLIPLRWSPIVDNGIASYECIHGETYQAPLYDILGNPRPSGAGYDMGAHDTINMVGIRHLNTGNATVYPNPFQHSTTFRYHLDKYTEVDLRIYDGTGRLVEEPVNKSQSPGIHEVSWNAAGFPAGVFYYRLQAEKQMVTGKIILMK
jgi:predicted outer membrane repeat protein